MKEFAACSVLVALVLGLAVLVSGCGGDKDKEKSADKSNDKPAAGGDEKVTCAMCDKEVAKKDMVEWEDHGKQYMTCSICKDAFAKADHGKQHEMTDKVASYGCAMGDACPMKMTLTTMKKDAPAPSC